MPTGYLRADGDREALRILLGARHGLTVATTGQTNRALLLGGDDTEREMARADAHRSRAPAMARRRRTTPGQPRTGRAARRDPTPGSRPTGGASRVSANRAQSTIVDEIAPGLTERRGIGAVTAAQAIVSFSHPGRAEATPHSPRCRAPVHAGQRQDSSASAQPRRPGPEQRNPHHRGDPHAVLPHDQGLRHPSQSRGKSSREIQRCLKRYIARELYRALNASTTLTAEISAPPAAA